MSQYPPALKYVLDEEDPRRQYKNVPDSGGYAIAGVNSHAWPSDYVIIFNAPVEKRPQLVYDFYQKKFWNPMMIGGIDFQDIANRVLDEGVNAGGDTSIKLLQMCLVQMGHSVKIDGILGPDTRTTVNAQDPERLIALFRNIRLSHYKKIADNNPTKIKYLGNWERRALA